MHYATPGLNFKLGPLNKFLKEMGVGEMEPQPSLKITSTSIPEETRVVVLRPESQS